MRISFEPGDGSFDITLKSGEKLPRKWNVKGVAVWVEDKGGEAYRLVKGYYNTLDEDSSALRD